MLKNENHAVFMILIIMISGLLLATCGDTGDQMIEKWGVFQVSVKNSKDYTDPFRDVQLDVKYKSPNGNIVEFWGFYDGDHTWKIRFMPDQTGTWEYNATFSDGSKGIKGTFECVDSDIPGMISVYKDNPIWFGYKNGKATLLRSFHVGDMFFTDNANTLTGEQWSADKRKTFLDWAQSQGYNTLSIASHYLNRVDKNRGAGWDTPDLWDSLKQVPKPKEYARMEVILNDLSDRKFMVFPFAGFLGRKSDFPKELENQKFYIKYTLGRLGPYWNLLFNVSGPEPRLKNKSFLTYDHVNKIGQFISKMDVFQHPLTVHNQTGDDEFKDQDWLSFGTLQGPKTVNRRKLYDGLLKNHHPSKPLYAQETLWPGNMYHKDEYTHTDIRKNAFVMLMAATDINFADMDGNSSSGFSGHMDMSMLHQERHDIIKRVWDLFESFSFSDMIPRPDLVDNGYCLANHGKEYLVYFETRGKAQLLGEKGTYSIECINPVTHAKEQSTDFQLPGEISTPDSGDDWVIHLIRKN